MEITIERAKIEELKEIQALNLKLFEKEKREYDQSLNLDWTYGLEGAEYFTDRITKDDGCVFVARDGDKLVGYMAGGLTERESYRTVPICAELEDTFVLEDYRFQGIGSKLYAKLVEWCQTKGVSKIVVEVSVQNNLGLDFYRLNGFNDYSTILETDL